MDYSSSSSQIELPGFLKPYVDVEAEAVMIVAAAVVVSMTMIAVMIIAVMVVTTVETNVTVLTSVAIAIMAVVTISVAVTTMAVAVAIMTLMSSPVVTIIVVGMSRPGFGSFRGSFLRHSKASSKKDEKQKQKDLLTHGFSPPCKGNRTGDYLPV